MEEQPLVSVCVISYQHERFIREAINGILSQKTSFDFELLIYDDASSDASQEIIREMCREAPSNISVRLFFQEENMWSRGISGSNAILYPAVKGKYVALCEGDDYWLDPLKLQKQVDFMENHPDYAMCLHPGKILYEGNPAGRSDEYYPGGKFHRIFSRKKRIPLDYMLRGNMATTASVMYRWKYYGEAFSEVFPQGINPGDWYMHLLHAKDGKIGYLPEIMSVYRKHQGGMYSSLENNQVLFYRKYKELELAFYEAVFKLFSGKKKETALWNDTYTGYLLRMLHCFLSVHDEESLLWFWNRFPDRFERLLALNYFNFPANGIVERLGRLIVRMGLKEGGFHKTVYRIFRR